jgi:PUB domain/Ubiquitin family
MSDDKITVQLTITAASGAPRIPLEISKSINASDLRLEASKLTKIPISSMKIIFRGRLIADDASKEAVTEYTLENGSVIHCIGKPVDNSVSIPSPSGSAVTAASSIFPRISTAATTSVPTAATNLDPMKAALQTLRASNSPSIYQTAVTTLEKILGNIVDNALEEKYRKMKKMNPAFQRRLGGLPGGDAAMKTAGFVIENIDGDDQYVMKATEIAWPSLVSNRNTVLAAVRAANAPALANPLSFPLVPSAAGGINNGLGLSTNPFSGSNMNEAIENWMYDPATMQAMMQVRLWFSKF